jgi:hypothetical protein
VLVDVLVDVRTDVLVDVLVDVRTDVLVDVLVDVRIDVLVDAIADVTVVLIALVVLPGVLLVVVSELLGFITLKFDAGINLNVPALPISQNPAVHDWELQSLPKVQGNPNEQRNKHDDPQDDSKIRYQSYYRSCT